MTACSFNNFIIFAIYLSFIFHPSHGFEVIQPHSRTVNPDGVASISCEHTANGSSVVDVRLNGITDEPTMLCQKGMEDCKNIIMHQESPKKWLFIMLNVGQEALDMKYQCEFTVKKQELDYTEKGVTPTRLLPGQKEVVCEHPPPPSWSHQLRWILIGLLALMFLYSCVITFFYISLRIFRYSLSFVLNRKSFNYSSYNISWLVTISVQQQRTRELHLCRNEKRYSAEESAFRRLLRVADSSFSTNGLMLSVTRGKKYVDTPGGNLGPL